ncbi:MAG: FMN-binding protein [Dehalococcoidales bacterium]|jgi:electron transport complex protein RnfG|nr:FMN-binding protein [Dehalococcoidales bacterium]
MNLSYLKKFYSIIFLTGVVMIAVTLLGLTFNLTEEKILEQEHSQFLAHMAKIFPDMTHFEYENDIYILYNEEGLEGYAFVASAAGYSGNIKIMVGLEDKETVKGIVIMSHTETPGIGTRILDPPFISQFEGMEIDLIKSNVDTLTGATVSSKAVIDAVSKAAKEKVALLS